MKVLEDYEKREIYQKELAKMKGHYIMQKKKRATKRMQNRARLVATMKYGKTDAVLSGAKAFSAGTKKAYTTQNKNTRKRQDFFRAMELRGRSLLNEL